jgi:hypothetical protein
MSSQSTQPRLPGTHRSARTVEPELLDELPADNPDAIRSRSDLRRINRVMGNGAVLARLIGSRPKTIAELGGGDGTLLLEVVRRLGLLKWPARIVIVDRANVVSSATIASFTELGCTVEPAQADVFSWLRQSGEVDLIAANLFLHHFEDTRLAELLALVAERARSFAACEPRRLRFPRLAGALVGLIGCNRVTRHDAVASIRAGFVGQELSALWPKAAGWELWEAPASLCSHGFRARRSVA